jgi:hypothetical protein
LNNGPRNPDRFQLREKAIHLPLDLRPFRGLARSGGYETALDLAGAMTGGPVEDDGDFRMPLEIPQQGPRGLLVHE